MNVPMRVVLDTNVLVSTLLFQSSATAPLMRAWQTGVIRPLASKETVQELVRVLAYPKFKLSPKDQDELLADYLPHVETVRIGHPLPVVPACRDEGDLPFLHLAVAGQAQALITGDQDLHAVAEALVRLCGCKVYTPDAFPSPFASST